MKTRPKTRLREHRIIDIPDLEVRAEGDQPPIIVGHPIRYNVWSEDLGGFRERILPGAATKTIGEADIRALVNHDPNFVLGRNRAQTLHLTDEAGGVRSEITPPDTTWAADLLVSMRRRDITQMSFAFRTIHDDWRAPDDPKIVKRDGLWERDVSEFQMFDISVVTFPAFTQTDAHVRSLIGELDGIGIDWPALNALLTRAERGLTITDTDVDLLNGSIDVLRSYIPVEPDPVALGFDGAAGAPLTEPQAGRSVAHLRALLDVEELSLLTV